MSNQNNIYAEYNRKKEFVSALINDVNNIFDSLNLTMKSERCKILANKIKNDTFKIQVVGTFKNGKSTFINSFLGEEVLPAYASPCTAIINEVKYGESKRAVLHFKDKDEIAELPKKLPESVRRHMQMQSGNHIEPMEIPVDQIEDYAVIPIGSELSDMLKESPYKKIELFWPLELLKNGIEIIDSPGLNENEVRTQVTLEYLKDADAILFILAADKLCAKDEMDFIEDPLKKYGFDNIFFIVNRFDTLRTERDRIGIVNLAKKTLIEKTSLGENGIFFVSAIDALDGKLDNDMTLYEKSKMPLLENALSEYLTSNKGKIKLTTPANELQNTLEEVLSIDIPMRANSLNSPLTDLFERRDSVMPRLESLKERKEKLKIRIDELVQEALPDIEEKISSFFVGLDSQIPVWVNEMAPKAKISLIHPKQSASDYANEALEILKEQIAREQNNWQENTLSPLIKRKVDGICKAIESSIENFYMELDKIKFEFSGAENVDAETDIPAWQRVAAAAGGFFVSGVAGAALGGMEGFSKDFIKGILTQMGIYLGLAFIGLLNPVTIIATIVGSLVFSGLNASNKIESTIKEKVAEGVRESVNNASIDSGNEIINKISDSLYSLGNTVIEALDREINEVQNQFDNIINEIESGQNDIERKKAALNDYAQRLNNAYAELKSFVASM